MTIEPPGPLASTCRSAGIPENVGGLLSVIVTVKLPLAVFPAPSVAEQFTVVVPRWNVVPDVGAQLTAGAPDTASVELAE